VYVLQMVRPLLLVALYLEIMFLGSYEECIISEQLS
jgi:hypothetical protein